MDGANINIGLAVIGAAVPITAAILTYCPRRNGSAPAPAAAAAGSGERCQEHGEHLERLDANQKHVLATLERIDKRTERIDDHLRGAGGPPATV